MRITLRKKKPKTDMNTKTQDARDLSRQIRVLFDKLRTLEDEKNLIPMISPRFDEILLERNNIRIKLTALRIRLENLGNLSQYAVPENLRSMPRA